MSALAFLFHYKRLRRSSRFDLKSSDTNRTNKDGDSEHHQSIGLFELLPLELKFHIFTYLSGMYSTFQFFDACVVCRATATGPRARGILPRQPAINNKLAPKPTPKPNLTLL